MIVTATVGAVSAVVFGVGAGTAGYVAVDGDGIHDWYRRGINDPHKAWDLELGQSTLAAHLPNMSACPETVSGPTAAAQVSEVLVCCARKATRVPCLISALDLTPFHHHPLAPMNPLHLSIQHHLSVYLFHVFHLFPHPVARMPERAASVPSAGTRHGAARVPTCTLTLSTRMATLRRRGESKSAQNQRVKSRRQWDAHTR
jgi:hypothetical protein